MEAQYAAIDKKGKVKETSYTELYSTPYKEQPFDPKIPTTLPIPLNEMSDYVASCHSDNNKALHSQFEVILSEVTHNVCLIM